MLDKGNPILKRDDDLGMGEAFGRDPMLESRVRQLVAAHAIQYVIETGSWRGYTTRRFSEFVKYIWTIDNNAEMTAAARRTLAGVSNAMALTADSASMLRGLIPTLRGPTLYYLDAHWDMNCPLLKEIAAIAELNAAACVIVVHDIHVPGTNLGYDSYGGQPLTLDLLKPQLDKLKFPWRHSFNDDSAQGHRRGVLFVEPQYANA